MFRLLQQVRAAPMRNAGSSPTSTRRTISRARSVSDGQSSQADRNRWAWNDVFELARWGSLLRRFSMAAFARPLPIVLLVASDLRSARPGYFFGGARVRARSRPLLWSEARSAAGDFAQRISITTGTNLEGPRLISLTTGPPRLRRESLCPTWKTKVEQRHRRG